jgi:cell division protein FtsW
MRRSYADDRSSGSYDLWLIFSVIALMAFGLLMVASASMVISDKQFSYPFHYLLRQATFAGIGIVVAVAVSRIRMEIWERYSSYLLLLALLMLIAVLIPGIGHVVNGSRRWISLGIVSLQVSEVVKLCFILYLAGYISRYEEQICHGFWGFFKPLILLALVGVLLLLEPDFGSLAVLSLTVLMMLFLAGVRLLPFMGLFSLMALAMSSLAIFSPYRLLRLTTFLNPWHHAFGSGYQLTQSLIAFGRGGLFGVGLGNSIQKLFYLPEAHTDFIFAVVAEELGLMGELLLITLFFIIVFRVFKIGRCAQAAGSLFNGFFCYGSALWLALQALINIGVNTGLLPTKGLTFPFVSYGGSSLLINCILVAIAIRIAYETPLST